MERLKMAKSVNNGSLPNQQENIKQDYIIAVHLYNINWMAKWLQLSTTVYAFAPKPCQWELGKDWQFVWGQN